MTDVRHDWEPFALLLIDVQRDFWPESIAQAHPGFPANIAALLTFCRNEKIEVVHIRASFRADRTDWMPRYRLRGGIPCVQGTPGEEPMPFAVEKPGEKVILKQTFDGFHNPELFQYLSARGKRHVLTAGLITSTCVLLTTASAMQKGFLATVVQDCCADEPDAHRQTLERYTFIFDRTSVGSLAAHHAQWMAALRNLDEGQHLRLGDCPDAVPMSRTPGVWIAVGRRAEEH